MQQGTAAHAVRVLIADDVIHAVAGLEKLADYADEVDVIGVARDPLGLFEDARLLSPDVVLIHQGFGATDMGGLLDELSESRPELGVVLVVEPGTDGAEVAASGTAAGVVVVHDDLDGAELVAALLRAAGPRLSVETGQLEPGAEAEPAPHVGEDVEATVPMFALDTLEPTAHVAIPDLQAVPAVPELEPIEPIRPRRVRRATKGKAETFIVFSGKGGVGKSLVATNLAVALSADGGRVVIVDLDLQFGDVAVMLHAEAHPTAIDALAQQGDQVDSDFIEEVMATGPEDVRILLAPASPEFADLVTTGNLRAILRELAKGFDYIVVDAPAHLEERTLEVIETADQVIVVTGFNITAVKDTKITLKLLQSLGIPKERIAVVLNQTRAKVGFPRSEVEDSLRFRILTQLPYEPRVDDSIDSGKPIVLAEPKSDFAKQFRVLVDYLAGAGHAERRDVPAQDAAKPRAKANRRRFSLGRG